MTAPATRRARIAVLASGGGSNLGAVLDYLDAKGEARAADVVLVASDRPDAGALRRAEARGIATAVLQGRRAPEGTPPGELLDPARFDLVALAGYLQLVPAEVVRRFPGRMINVHPALLPAFGGAGMYGARVHRAVLAAGARVTGVTVHEVSEEYDRGPILAQWPVPAFPEVDTPEALAARVLRIEHALFPRVLHRLALSLVRPRDPEDDDFVGLDVTDIGFAPCPTRAREFAQSLDLMFGP